MIDEILSKNDIQSICYYGDAGKLEAITDISGNKQFLL